MYWYINGRWVKGKDVDSAMSAARSAFEGWRNLSLNTRKNFLKSFAAKLKKYKKDFAVAISQETGKPLWESFMEVEAMINKIPISFKAYEERCAVVSNKEGTLSHRTRFRAHGVIVVVGPFNLPGHLPLGHIVPALLAGNTVVFKPSEKTPLVGEKIAKIWEEAGLPKGVFNLVQGAKETAQALVAHPGLDGLFFTGSAEAGQSIHRALCEHPEKILALEMGGNNPLIAADVKDVTAAAYLTIQSAFITSGQRCSCARRLIVVQGKNSGAFITRLVELTQKIKIGFWTDRPEPFMGPVISKEAAQRVRGWQDEFSAKGAEILTGLGNNERSPLLLRPAIVDVSALRNRPDVEIFGPFLQLIRVKNLEEAIQEANRTAFGLTAGLLSGRESDYKKFSQKIRAGIVNWNRPLTGASSEAPFGGVGKSGNHRPSAYFAADYCSYPVASMESAKLTLPVHLFPGISV